MSHRKTVALSLPSLPYATYKNGKRKSFGEIEDPRVRFCKCFNEISADFGLEARPLPPEHDKPHRVYLTSLENARPPVLVFAAATKREALDWLAGWQRGRGAGIELELRSSNGKGVRHA